MDTALIQKVRWTCSESDLGNLKEPDLFINTSRVVNCTRKRTELSRDMARFGNFAEQCGDMGVI